MSSATYPDPGYACTQWSTDKQRTAALGTVQFHGEICIAAAAINLMVALFTFRYSPKIALPFMIAGAIGLGTSIPLVRLTDVAAVNDTKTTNLQNVATFAALAPAIVYIVAAVGDLFGDFRNARAARRSGDVADSSENTLWSPVDQ